MIINLDPGFLCYEVLNKCNWRDKFHRAPGFGVGGGEMAPGSDLVSQSARADLLC